MKGGEFILHGQISPDGTLKLDAHSGLPIGPVEVVIRPLPAPPTRKLDWWQYLQQARDELEHAGRRFRSKEEIDADIESLRLGDERIEDVRRRADRERRP